MSLAKYVAELRPDPGMRQILAASSLVSLLLGLVVIVELPIDRGLRWLAATGWVALLAHDFWRRLAAQRQLQRIRVFADGTAVLQGRDCAWVPAILSRDCVVLAHLAWVVLHADGGRRHYELLRGNLRENKEWRRFHVIWRHLSGRPPGRLGSSL